MNDLIILDNFGDLLVFKNELDLVSYVEAIDVENSEYIAYDRKGNTLNLRLNPLRHICIDNDREFENRADELKDKMKNYLIACGVSSESLKELNLEAVMGLAEDFTIKV